MLPDKTLDISSIHFLNAQEGWAAGQRSVTGVADLSTRSMEAALIHTVDGGKTWAVIPTGFKEEPQYFKVHFSNAQVGWLVSYESLYRTNDGGQSWQRVLKVSDPRFKDPYKWSYKLSKQLKYLVIKATPAQS